VCRRSFETITYTFQVIPLFVTSLLIPFLCVILQVVRTDDKPHKRLDAKDAAKYVFAAMWTPVIMLLLGGFTVAAALSKYDIAKRIAVFVLSKAGTRPRTVLLTNMFVAAFASMWISNVAAPVLCLSLIQVISFCPPFPPPNECSQCYETSPPTLICRKHSFWELHLLQILVVCYPQSPRLKTSSP
jgi:di/tricarboxylate transporter